MRQLLSTFFILFNILLVNAQMVQTIRGKIIDKDSHQPLIGVNVVIQDPKLVTGAMTDINGEFRIDNVKVGRYTIVISYLGYKTITLNNMSVVSGKQTVLNIELEEQAVKINEVVVLGKKKGETSNKMATVSVRSFTVEETEKYAGSLGDPARMAANYAGVSRAGDDRNDIIIRGNSPIGLLWRLEGVDVANPNHWGASGTTGGAISILNNKTLANSDFFTGAFPAEYSNALSGVFDLKMRAGNNSRTELTGQIGFNGFEVMAEGPFSKNYNGSYMVSYRYSILEIMDALGFKVAGGAVPEYKDLTMKIDLPTRSIGNFALFGITGNSYIEILSDETSGTEKFNTPTDDDTYNGTRLFISGLTHKLLLNDKSYLNSAVAFSSSRVHTRVDSVFMNRVGGTDTNPVLKKQAQTWYGENNIEEIVNATTKYVLKYNPRNSFTVGVSVKHTYVNFKDSIESDDGDYFEYQTRIKKRGLWLLQSYAHWQHKFNNNLTLNTGLNYQQFTFNNSYAVEPRLGLKYELKNGANMSLGYGLHSRMQPMLTYFVETFNNGIYRQTNNNLGFTKAHHFILGYDKRIGANYRFKAEAYYQHLFNVPVESELSNVSILNQGAEFHLERNDSLVNRGKGRNYGVELTFEKYLHNNWYMLITGSLFDSRYRGSDNVWRNTAFAGNFSTNILAGYEYKISDSYSLNTNAKVTWAGGKRNQFIDLEASVRDGEEVFDDSKAYAEREKDYFKLDFRISVKNNCSRFNQELALDITNLTGHRNVYSRSFNEGKGKIDYVYQQGFFLMVLYRINFGW